MNKSNLKTINIHRLGHLGDGIGKAQEAPEGDNIFVPFTLEGEEVLADCTQSPAGLIEIKQASPNRIPPICEHFTQCGGCQMQHLEQSHYDDWKMGILNAALQSQNIKAKISPIIHVPIKSRRRTILSAMRIEGKVELGFLKRQSHALIPINTCPLLKDEITQSFEKLREIAILSCPHKGALKMQVIACDNGLDVTLSNVDNLGNKLRRALTLALEDCSIIRLSHEDEVILEKQKPFITQSGHQIFLQPSAFCQASFEAETKMAELVKDHLSSCKFVVDLFAGSGTFSFAMAHHVKTHAIEVNSAAIDALNASRSQASGIKPLSTEVRDLYRRPLQAHELKAYDGLIFDPPRAGAKSQMAAIVQSNITKIAAISCNPNSLAEDLAILIKGGFAIKALQPIDQFLFSPHLEVVAILERKSPERRKKIFG